MHPGSPRVLRLKRGPTNRACVQCGLTFPSREPSHRVCQACHHQFTRLRLLTQFDPWLTQPSRGRWVEGRSALG